MTKINETPAIREITAEDLRQACGGAIMHDRSVVVHDRSGTRGIIVQ